MLRNTLGCEGLPLDLRSYWSYKLSSLPCTFCVTVSHCRIQSFTSFQVCFSFWFIKLLCFQKKTRMNVKEVRSVEWLRVINCQVRNKNIKDHRSSLEKREFFFLVFSKPYGEDWGAHFYHSSHFTWAPTLWIHPKITNLSLTLLPHHPCLFFTMWGTSQEGTYGSGGMTTQRWRDFPTAN